MDNKSRAAAQPFADLLGDLPDNIFQLHPSPLDRPIAVSRFRDLKAKSVTVKPTSLRTLAKEIAATHGASKDRLPLLKLGRFGDARTEGGAVRHEANLQSISGIEGDYDAEQVSPDDAAASLRDAGIAALIYTTPSHSPAAPRWRVLAPLSAEASPTQRDDLCARLNGALGGILEAESFTRSQAYYMGQVAGAAPVQTILMDGQPIDKLPRIRGVWPAHRPRKPQRESMASLLGEIPADDAESFSDADLMTDADWSRIKSALGAIEDASERQTWLEIGQALHAASDGAERGFNLWCEWSRQSEKFNERDQRRTWRSFRRGGITIATLMRHALDAGWQESTGETAAAPADGLIEWFHETPLPQTAPYLVRGILDQGATSCMYGASNSGKTFAAVDLAYGLATARDGSTWNGARIKRAAVLYCALEGGAGFQKRVRALQEHTGERGKIPFAYRRRGANLLAQDDKGDVKTIVAAARELQRDETAKGLPMMIVIDTLSRALAGGDENGPQDMTAFIGNIDRIREATGAHVLIVHHTGKDQAKGMRGHTSLLAAIDSELEVSRPDGGRVVSLRVGKQRDSRSDYDLANAELVTVRIGTDEEGDAIESAVMAWGIGKPAQPVKLTKPQEIAMQVFNTLGDGEPVSRDKLISACVAAGVSGAKDDKSRRRGVKCALDELTDKEVLTFENEMYRTFHPDDLLGFEDLGELSKGENGENGGKSPIFPTTADIVVGGKRGKRPIGLSLSPLDAPSIFAEIL